MRRSWRDRWALWRMAALAAASVACGSSAAADDPIEIGRTIFVVNDVEGRMGEAEPKRVILNENVLYEEDIITADQAETIMEFRDGSTFEVGPGAVVRIDSFVFNPEESVSRKAVSVGRGVFRYISGIAANEQDTRISTASGVLAIRGSVVAGIVDPEVPTFVYVGEGTAVFTTPVKPPSTMPPAIAAQALQAIERRLPPRDVLRNRPQASQAWLRRAGAANLLPVAAQAQRQGAAAGRPLPATAVASPIARELGLLVEGHRRNLFDGAQTTRTPEQEAFVTATARTLPNAATLIARSTAQAGALHQSARLAATAVVIRGVAAAAPSPEVVTRVATESFGGMANEGGTAQIEIRASWTPVLTQSATAGLQGPARARVAMQLGKAAAEAKKTRERAAIPASAPPNQVAAGAPEQRTPPAQLPARTGAVQPRPERTAATTRPAPPRQQAETRPPSRPPATEGGSAPRPGKPPATTRPPLRQQMAARAPLPRRQASTRPRPKQAPRKQPVRNRRDEAR